MTADCRCLAPAWDYRDYHAEFLGVDRENGRFGEVSRLTCRQCGRRWLLYQVEYEAVTGSGRW